MVFEGVPKGPVDVMFVLKQESDRDTSPDKIDAGIGVYRSDHPGYHEFQAIAKAKALMQQHPANHEYNETTGISSFVDASSELVFGRQMPSVASVQTVGGTGAVRLGAAFLNRNYPTYSSESRSPNPTAVYIGTPAWPNYVPLFQHAGFKTQTFRHYDPSTETVDMQAVLSAIAMASRGSIFVLQVCCHNPTGQDYSQGQWNQLADALQARSHFVFFDMAYQGFAHNMETDAWPVRYFATRGLDFLVCQSFSKHMGLYSERVGALHVYCKSPSIAANVKDQLRSLIRWEVSSTPAFGANLADTVMRVPGLRELWLQEVQQACDRMVHVRKMVYDLLAYKLNVSGGPWDHILREKGLFSYMKLNKNQVKKLREEHHMYLAESGRVNIAGLNEGNVKRFALALQAVLGSNVAIEQVQVVQSRL